MSNIHNYLANLQIEKARNEESMVKLLMKFYTEKRSARYYNRWADELENRFYNPSAVNQQDIYSLMNEEYYCSLAMIGGWDYDRFIYQGEWIEKNKDLFGKTVVDLGCLNGLLTCFIALQLPDSYIYGIDINYKSIQMAKKLAKNLKIENVKFTCVPFTKISGKYDTVFTSMLYHETFDTHIPKDFNSLSEEEQIEYWCTKTNTCVSKIASLIEENGNAICFERLYRNIALCGLLKSFANNQLFLDIQNITVKSGIDRDDIILYLLEKSQKTLDYKTIYKFLVER